MVVAYLRTPRYRRSVVVSCDIGARHLLLRAASGWQGGRHTRAGPALNNHGTGGAAQWTQTVQWPLPLLWQPATCTCNTHSGRGAGFLPRQRAGATVTQCTCGRRRRLVERACGRPAGCFCAGAHTAACMQEGWRTPETRRALSWQLAPVKLCLLALAVILLRDPSRKRGRGSRPFRSGASRLLLPALFAVHGLARDAQNLRRNTTTQHGDGGRQSRGAKNEQAGSGVHCRGRRRVQRTQRAVPRTHESYARRSPGMFTAGAHWCVCAWPCLRGATPQSEARCRSGAQRHHPILQVAGRTINLQRGGHEERTRVTAPGSAHRV